MDQEKRFALTKKGRFAQAHRADINERVDAQEKQIIRSLVSSYRAGTLTDFELRGKIGEIVGLHNLLGKMQTEVKLGIMADNEEKSRG